MSVKLVQELTRAVTVKLCDWPTAIVGMAVGKPPRFTSVKPDPIVSVTATPYRSPKPVFLAFTVQVTTSP